ncbi:hypothetical protein [Rhizobium sp. BK602]|uniref:hypothetical protein n=1 Tax=Rhizobium sp. BK602 TaxID=2586986 RepID=UPI00161AE282|nr:hypothetical protein [Rhizobium sp. BK602]MBB3610974.1 hypothetical protein [Rhizobium sp. BK602]
MFFNRNKPQDRQPVPAGLTDGIEGNVAAFVKDWGALKRGERQPVADSKDPALQLLTSADVAYFVKAMEDEAGRIEAEMDQMIADRKRQHQAEIAQKDAQIAAINREIETHQARLKSQQEVIDQRVTLRVDLLDTVAKIMPHLDASKMSDDDIRRAVVRDRFGAGAVEGKPQAYVDARFDIVADSLKIDPFREVMRGGLRTQTDGKAAADKAYEDMVRSLNDAHKTRH